MFVPGENEVTEMGKRLVYCKAVNPMQAAYPDAVVAKSLRACCGRRTEKKQEQDEGMADGNVNAERREC